MASAINAAIQGPRSLTATERAPETAANSAAPAAEFARALDEVSRRDAPTLVTPVRTQLDSGQASDALAAAWSTVTGEAPSTETVRVLTAQWAHETGSGASMFNYNFGGIKGTGPSGLSVSQRTREGYGASERRIVDNFRAYRSAEEGATDYVRLLSRRYPAAVDAARAGDPAGFVKALKTGGYFTGDAAAYTRSVVTLAGMAPVHRGEHAGPPLLDAPRAVAPTVGAGLAFSAGPVQPSSAPLIDALALADEISRAALRIAAESDSKGRRG